MTLVLAAKTKEGVFIGSDAQATAGWHHFNSQPKLIRIHDYVVGFTVSYRTGQLIEHNANRFPEIKGRADVYKFVQSLRSLMEDDGQRKEANMGEHMNHLVGLLLATPDEIWSIEKDYSFHEFDRWAIGSGYMYGIGYFDALAVSTSPAKRIRLAIEAAGKVVQGVGGPVAVYEVKR